MSIYIYRRSLAFCQSSMETLFHIMTCAHIHIVGEEDEVSIKEVAAMIAEAMDFKGELVVRCLYNIPYILCAL